MLLSIHPKNPEERKIEQVVDSLKNGGIIIYPTDSVYGIGCDIYNTKAVEKICRLKNIDPRKKQLSIICEDLSNISLYANVNNSTFKLMKRNLPGPFTFILKGSSQLPKLFKNRKTIGIRVPDNEILYKIVCKLGNPIMNTSILREEEVDEYTTDPELMEERFSAVADIVVDGGYGSLEATTIIDCTGSEPEIVRQGIGILK